MGHWSADDGYQPFDEGTWRLEWSGDTAELLTLGIGSMPVSPERHEVSCRR